MAEKRRLAGQESAPESIGYKEQATEFLYAPAGARAKILDKSKAVYSYRRWKKASVRKR